MISYVDKVVLAPMVRIGTLPMRLLALEYGADLVWSPEIIDKKLLTCKRVWNHKLGVCEYSNDRTTVLKIHPQEKEKLVVQLGSADPELALQAARLVKDDVSGIDLNCGCPKKFSIQGGMGAALLKEPSKLCEILRVLVAGLPELSISAKIRLLPNAQETLELVKKIACTGIRALTVHCRTADERPREAAHFELLRKIVEICPFPVLANGDMMHPKDLSRMKSEYGVAGIMLARAAQANVSIFSGNPLPIPIVTQKYLDLAIKYNHQFSNTKFAILQMWIDEQCTSFGKKFYQMLQASKSHREIANLLKIPMGFLDIENNADFDAISADLSLYTNATNKCF